MSVDAVPTPPLVLASGSPRRTELLRMLGIEHDIDPADVDEALLPQESAAAHVERLALEKAASVARRHPDALVLAGDTVVVSDGAVLGKPADDAEAVEMLLGLAGRAHEVLSGLALHLPSGGTGDAGRREAEPRVPAPGSSAEATRRSVARVDRTRVVFRPDAREVARAYVGTGEPLDKAGGYGIQGRGGALVSRVEGDYYTVVGLSVSGLLALLDTAGYRYTFRGIEPR